jgi:hypothetical protein
LDILIKNTGARVGILVAIAAPDPTRGTHATSRVFASMVVPATANELVKEETAQVETLKRRIAREE